MNHSHQRPVRIEQGFHNLQVVQVMNINKVRLKFLHDLPDSLFISFAWQDKPGAEGSAPIFLALACSGAVQQADLVAAPLQFFRRELNIGLGAALRAQALMNEQQFHDRISPNFHPSITVFILSASGSSLLEPCNRVRSPKP